MKAKDSLDGRFKLGKVYTNYGETEDLIFEGETDRCYFFTPKGDTTMFIREDEEDVKGWHEQGYTWVEEGMVGFSEANSFKEVK